MEDQLQLNKVAAAAFYNLFVPGNLDTAGEIFHSKWSIHPALPGEGTDLTKYLPLVTALQTAFPDVAVDIRKLIAESDLVAVQITISGTHSGPWLGVPATFKKIDILAHDIHRLLDGKIIESWHVEDWFTALLQMEALQTIIKR